MCFFFLSYARASSDLLVIEGILLYAQDTNYKGFWKKKLIDCEEPKNEKKFCSNVYILIFPWLQMIGEVTDIRQEDSGCCILDQEAERWISARHPESKHSSIQKHYCVRW